MGAQHRKNFDTIIDGVVGDFANVFSDVASQAAKDISGGRDLALEMLLTKFAHDLQRSVDRFSHECVKETWLNFDTNKDGYLQRDEMVKVVETIFKDIQDNIPGMVKHAMEPAADNLQQWIDSEAVGPMGMSHRSGGMQVAIHANVEARVRTASDKLSKLMADLMKALVENATEISGEMFETIDRDKNGKIDRKEFDKGFAEAFGTVCDFSKLTRAFLRQKPALLRSQSMAPQSDTTIVLGAGLLVLAMASAAYMAYKRQRH